MDEVVMHLQVLQIIKLEHCSKLPSNILSVILHFCTDLKELHLESIILADDTKSEKEIVQNENLERVIIQENSRLNHSIFIEHASKFPNLIQLVINDNDINFSSETYLSDIENIQLYKHLKHLDFNLLEFSTQPLLTALEQNRHHLEELILHNGDFVDNNFSQLLEFENLTKLIFYACHNITVQDIRNIPSRLDKLESLIICCDNLAIQSTNILDLVNRLPNLNKLTLETICVVPDILFDQLVEIMKVRNRIRNIKMKINIYYRFAEYYAHGILTTQENGDIELMKNMMT